MTCGVAALKPPLLPAGTLNAMFERFLARYRDPAPTIPPKLAALTTDRACPYTTGGSTRSRSIGAIDWSRWRSTASYRMAGSFFAWGCGPSTSSRSPAFR